MGYNLDFENPHNVAKDHGEPQTLLADIGAAEVEAARLRGPLEAIFTAASRDEHGVSRRFRRG